MGTVFHRVWLVVYRTLYRPIFYTDFYTPAWDALARPGPRRHTTGRSPGRVDGSEAAGARLIAGLLVVSPMFGFSLGTFGGRRRRTRRTSLTVLDTEHPSEEQRAANERGWPGVLHAYQRTLGC